MIQFKDELHLCKQNLSQFPVVNKQNKTEIIVKAIANKGRCLTADGIRQRTCDAALMISLLLESLRSGTGFHKEGQ